jgi:hypothetical protein
MITPYEGSLTLSHRPTVQGDVISLGAKTELHVSIGQSAVGGVFAPAAGAQGSAASPGGWPGQPGPEAVSPGLSPGVGAGGPGTPFTPPFSGGTVLVVAVTLPCCSSPVRRLHAFASRYVLR